jgi:hypothetical protein
MLTQKLLFSHQCSSKAEALLDEMHDAFVNGNEESVQLNVRSFASALDAWSKSGSPEAPQQAKQILARTCHHSESGELDAKPNIVSHTTWIECWVKSRQQGAAHRADAMFREMQDRCKAGDKVLLETNFVTHS